MLRYVTAGESHGKALMGILEGIPANLKIDFAFIDAELKRRQSGYGRGARMQIESDTAEFIAGIRGGVTTGAPIGFLIENRDYKNWEGIVGADAARLNERKLTAVRPGHADLAGCIKYAQKDARNILERASARSTAATVVIGAIAKQYLSALGITVSSEVLSVGGAKTEKEIKKRIDDALAAGDTLGGEIKLAARGLCVGLGSHTAADKRLEFKLAGHLAAIQSVKSVAFGNVCAYAKAFGSETHDALYYDKHGKIVRKTNNAGGIEGGISNGEELVITLVLKPVPSVPKGVPSVDIETKSPAPSARERGDACVTEAACAVAEAVLAYALAESVAETLGGDHMEEAARRMELKRKSAL